MTDPWPFCANDGTCSCAKFHDDPTGCERRAERLPAMIDRIDSTFDPFAHAAAQANPDCPKCKGKGSYMYDHNHGKICEVCCRHDRGWWQLGEMHANPGHWCCRAGCGYSVETKPEEPNA